MNTKVLELVQSFTESDYKNIRHKIKPDNAQFK